MTTPKERVQARRPDLVCGQPGVAWIIVGNGGFMVLSWKSEAAAWLRAEQLLDEMEEPHEAT
jgi:hypothetical protein